MTETIFERCGRSLPHGTNVLSLLRGGEAAPRMVLLSGIIATTLLTLLEMQFHSSRHHTVMVLLVFTIGLFCSLLVTILTWRLATARTLARKELTAKQDELERINQTLAQNVREAVEELRRNDQILISQSRHAAMGEMISNIAHQWRQPLNTIGLIIQYLQRTCHSDNLTREELGSEFHTALDLVMHMSRTIDEFRNFLSPDKIRESFNVSEAVSQALSFTTAYLNHSQIKVLVEGDDSTSIDGYRNEYAQVLLNIINNARDQLISSNVADPCITITTSTHGGSSVVTIHDNGGGIPDEIMDRIFDPYFTTKQKSKGTGIGLYMSRNIIEKHMGGSITAANKNGGAEFRIEV